MVLLFPPSPSSLLTSFRRLLLSIFLCFLFLPVPWSYELTTSLFWFSDNDDFVDAATLEQDPVWALQGHVTRNFSGNFWIGAGLAYAVGGDVTIDQQRIDYEVDNLIWNLVVNYRINPNQSVTLAWQQGRTQVDVGMDFDSWLLSWAYAWTR